MSPAQTTNNKQQTTNNKQLSQSCRVWQFELLRCIACLCVVFYHSTSELLNIHNYDYVGTLIHSVSAIGVPLFVMISGYFILSNSKNTNWSYFYKKRLKRIGVPILFWSFFYVLFSTVVLWHGNGAENLKWDNWLTAIYTGQMGNNGGHLWYLYMTWGLYLATPFLLTIYKGYSPKTVLSVSIMLYFAYFIQSQHFIHTTGNYRTELFVPLVAIALIPYFLFGKLLGDKMMAKELSISERRIIRTTAVIVFTVISVA